MRIRQSSAPGRIILAAAAAALLASCGSDDWADGTLQSAVAASISIDGRYAAAKNKSASDVKMKLTLDGTTFAAMKAKDDLADLVTVLVRKTDGTLATDTDVEVTHVEVDKDVTAGDTEANISVTMKSHSTMIDGIFVVSVDGTLLTSRKTVSGSGGFVKIGESYVTGEPLTLNAGGIIDATFTIVGVGDDSYAGGTVTVEFYDEAGNPNDDVEVSATTTATSGENVLTVTVSGKVEEGAYDATGYIGFTVPGFKSGEVGSGDFSRSTYRINGIHAALDLPTGAEVASAKDGALVTVINLARLNTALSTIPKVDDVVAKGTIGSKNVEAKLLPGATTTRIPVYFEGVSTDDIASGGVVELAIVDTITNGETPKVQQKTCENIATKHFWKDFEAEGDAAEGDAKEAEVFVGTYSGTYDYATPDVEKTSMTYKTTVPNDNNWRTVTINLTSSPNESPNAGRYVPVLFDGDSENGRYVTVAQKSWSYNLTYVNDAGETVSCTKASGYEADYPQTFGRSSNGSRIIYSNSMLSKLSGDFVLTFDLKLCNGNDQASSFYIGGSKYSDNATNALLGFAATAAGGTAWKVNGSYLEVKFPHSADWSTADDGSAITSLPWYTVMLKYKDGKGYLTLTDKATGEPLTDQFGTAITDTKIPVPSDVSTLGNIVFDSGRYYANFAIDNIAVLEVTPSIGR